MFLALFQILRTVVCTYYGPVFDPNMEHWMLGPPILVGDHVAYGLDSGAYVNATVRWMGRIPENFGQQLVIGLELVINQIMCITCVQEYLPPPPRRAWRAGTRYWKGGRGEPMLAQKVGDVCQHLGANLLNRFRQNFQG